MECTHQFINFTTGDINPRTGELMWKRKLFTPDSLKFLIKQKREWKLNKIKYKLTPCGECKVCKTNQTLEWSIRLLNESMTTRNAYFLTLTYNDDHIPASGSINKDEVRNFLHKLENAIYYYLERNFIKDYPPFKFYLCGEYGEKSKRPHYHAILFNVPFNDLTEFFPDDKGGYFRKCSKSGDTLLYSKTISSIWNKGYCDLGVVNHDSCCYVAGYVQKKLDDDVRKYIKNNLLPPFNIQTRGLGFDYFLKNYKRFCKTDQIFYKNKKTFMFCPIPRAYLLKLKKVDREAYAKLMLHRDLNSDMKIDQFLSMNEKEIMTYFRDKRYTNAKKINSFNRSTC